MKPQDLRRNSTLCEEGIWRDYETGEVLPEPEPGRFCLRIAYSQNPKARDLRAALLLTRRGDLVRAKDDPERSAAIHREIDSEVLATAILVDWAGLETDDGEPLPYTREKALQYMREPDFFLLRDFVRDISGLDGAYREEAVRAAVGN